MHWSVVGRRVHFFFPDLLKYAMLTVVKNGLHFDRKKAYKYNDNAEMGKGMGKLLQKVGRFYSRIIMRCMGILIFIGAMSVLFMERGWFPNEELNKIAVLAAQYLLPLVIAYEAGKEIGKQEGAVVAVLTTAGMLAADSSAGVLGAILVSPPVAWMVSRLWRRLETHVRIGMEMLSKNLLVSCLGMLCSISAYYYLSSMLNVVTQVIEMGCDYLIQKRLIGFASVLIEPAKIFFLNNSINYGVLTPMGFHQVQISGESILFLLETNPGPGLGVLLALYCRNRKTDPKYRQYLLSGAVELFGGIHEVYFPYILSNLWLIPSLVLGGFFGNLCFVLLNVGVAAPIVPGSILSIFFVASPENLPGILSGVIISASLSFLCADLTLWIQGKRRAKDRNLCGQEKTMNSKEQDMVDMEQNIDINNKKTVINAIHQIAFVCAAGLGSSAMGAALMRRKLRECGIEGIEVQAYPVDELPDGLEVIICQKNFRKYLPETDALVYPVENLLGQEEMDAFICQYLKKQL